MSIEGPDDLEGLQRAGRAAAAARDAMAAALAPGVSTADLDATGRDVLRAYGARSAPRVAYDFPGWTCISVNDELAHGVPSATRRLAAGDLVNLDVSVELDGYWADTGASFSVGEVPARLRQLLHATRRARDAAIRAARPGRPVGDVARAVSRRARRHRFQVVENLAGHGVGRFIHEDPEVPNVISPRSHRRLWEGLVITVEPFLTTGARHAVQAPDGWTLRTPDGTLGAQFEHTIVVRQGTPLVLT